MFAVLAPFWPLIWRIGAIVAATAAVLLAWSHFVAQPYIAKGVAQERVHTIAEKDRADVAEAANKALRTDLQVLGTRLKEAKDSIERLALLEAAARSAKDKVLAKLAAQEKTLNAEIDRLKAIAMGPPAQNKEEACDAATEILDALATHRLRE